MTQTDPAAPAASTNSAPKPRGFLSARRFALLGSVAVLGGGLLLGAPNYATHPHFPTFTTSAAAQTAMRPASFADIVEKVSPAVFAVRVKMQDTNSNVAQFGAEENPFPPGSPMERFFKRFGFGEGPDGMPRGRRGQGGNQQRHFSMAQGSGFFISADGYAVTNNHVVERGESVEIKGQDGKTYKAKVIGTDPRTDIALLKVDGRTDFPFVEFADKPPRVGDWVLAVGNPFGLGGTVTAGIVSASGRDIGAGPYDDFIQIDAPVNKGNSGGPTFDVNGTVIGVNTAIYSPSGGNVGIAFAIPSDTVKSIVAQLREKGTVSRGWIGVQIQPVTQEIADSLGLKEVRGALVAEPQPNGPAAKAGILAGDVILGVNGQPVRDARDLAKRIGGIAPGEGVKLTLFRKGSETTVSLTLGTLPNEQRASAEPSTPKQESPDTGMPGLGLSLAPGGSGEGVVVANVDADGPAAERGFKSGDVILEVAGQTVSSPADVRKAIDGARDQGKRMVLLRVKSGDTSRFVPLPVGRA